MKYRNRIPVLEYESEWYYELLDPYTEKVMPDYLISKSAKLLSRKRSKNDEYKLRAIHKRMQARNSINFRVNQIHIQRYMDEIIAYNFLDDSEIKNTCDKYGCKRLTIRNQVMTYYRFYYETTSIYIIHIDGNINNDDLKNLKYTNYKDYINHCKKYKRKPIIKYKDKLLMYLIYTEFSMSAEDVAKVFNISPSGLWRIIKMILKEED